MNVQYPVRGRSEDFRDGTVPEASGPSYRPDIDGLRGLAVGAVVLFHAGMPFAPGGFVGVDIFFVISGYLISRILLEETKAGQFSLARFYERRARRILPALIAVSMATAVVAAIFFLPPYLVDFGKSLVGVALFSSNFYFWKYSGYFESSALLRPLLHTWSLGVEEQFYIVAPAAIFLIVRLARRHVTVLLAAGCLVSLAASIFLTDRAPTANFFLLPTRAWELLLGALLASLGGLTVERRWGIVGTAVALSMLLASVCAFTSEMPFPGLLALLPCGGAALAIYAGAGVGANPLCWRWLVWLGKISYSLYLIHWPVFVFARYITLREPNLMTGSLGVGISLGLAWLCYAYIETPVRQRTVLASRRQIFASSLAGLMMCFAIGGSLIAFNGLPSRFPDYVSQQSRMDAASGWGEGTCFLQAGDPLGHWDADRCTIAKGGSRRVLLWGDSYAAHYVPGLTLAGGSLGDTIIQYTYAGCPPVLDYFSYARPDCEVFNRHVLDVIDEAHIDTVVMSARWVDIRGRGLESIGATIRALSDRGVRVILLGQSPVFATNVDVIAFEKGGRGDGDDRWPDMDTASLNAQLGRLVGPDDLFVDPTASFCRADGCLYTRDGRLLFSDDGHLSRAGSIFAVDRYFPHFGR